MCVVCKCVMCVMWECVMCVVCKCVMWECVMCVVCDLGDSSHIPVEEPVQQDHFYSNLKHTHTTYNISTNIVCTVCMYVPSFSCMSFIV